MAWVCACGQRNTLSGLPCLACDRMPDESSAEEVVDERLAGHSRSGSMPLSSPTGHRFRDEPISSASEDEDDRPSPSVASSTEGDVAGSPTVEEEVPERATVFDHDWASWKESIDFPEADVDQSVATEPEHLGEGPLSTPDGETTAVDPPSIDDPSPEFMWEPNEDENPEATLAASQTHSQPSDSPESPPLILAEEMSVTPSISETPEYEVAREPAVVDTAKQDVTDEISPPEAPQGAAAVAPPPQQAVATGMSVRALGGMNEPTDPWWLKETEPEGPATGEATPPGAAAQPASPQGKRVAHIGPDKSVEVPELSQLFSRESGAKSAPGTGSRSEKWKGAAKGRPSGRSAQGNSPARSKQRRPERPTGRVRPEGNGPIQEPTRLSSKVLVVLALVVIVIALSILFRNVLKEIALGTGESPTSIAETSSEFLGPSS